MGLENGKTVRLTVGRHGMIQSSAKCAECGRVFDLFDEDEANEWHYGHDCEGE